MFHHHCLPPLSRRSTPFDPAAARLHSDDRHVIFYNLLRGVAGGELVIREDMALASISAGSAVEFSPDEMQQLLRRCEEECEIMRSRGNIYFV